VRASRLRIEEELPVRVLVIGIMKAEAVPLRNF